MRAKTQAELARALAASGEATARIEALVAGARVDVARTPHSVNARELLADLDELAPR